MDWTLLEAVKFAQAAHEGQQRKYTHEPYINHCLNVMQLVSMATTDTEMIAAAVLHDTIEDTSVDYNVLRRKFGSGVANLVVELTDVYTLPEHGNRKVRKEKEKDRLATISHRAQTIKLADLIDNTSTISKYDKSFAKVYMNEKLQLLEVLKEGDNFLWDAAYKIVNDYYQEES